MPDIGAAHYLIALFQEAGTIVSTGMGAAPLSWVEINSWLSVTERTIPLWEKTIVRELSEAYVAEYNRASDPSRPAPFDSVEVKRQEVTAQLKNLFSSMKQQ